MWKKIGNPIENLFGYFLSFELNTWKDIFSVLTQNWILIWNSNLTFSKHCHIYIYIYIRE